MSLVTRHTGRHRKPNPQKPWVIGTILAAALLVVAGVALLVAG